MIKQVLLQLLFLLSLADIGIRNSDVLISKSEKENNTRGNAMNIEWWVYTSTEETEPYSILKMNLYLNASKPIDGSTLYWGVSFLKKAGSMLSYDVVLCNHTYFEEHF